MLSYEWRALLGEYCIMLHYNIMRIHKMTGERSTARKDVC